MQVLGLDIRRARKGDKEKGGDLKPLAYRGPLNDGEKITSEEQHLDKINRAASDGAAHFFRETGPLIIEFLRGLKNVGFEFLRDAWSAFSGPAKFAVWVVAIILLVGFVGGKMFSAAEWWIDGHTQGVVRQTIGTTHRVGDQMDRRIPDPPPVPEPTAAPQSQCGDNSTDSSDALEVFLWPVWLVFLPIFFYTPADDQLERSGETARSARSDGRYDRSAVLSYLQRTQDADDVS